jgi:hypothetical protein
VETIFVMSAGRPRGIIKGKAAAAHMRAAIDQMSWILR